MWDAGPIISVILRLLNAACRRTSRDFRPNLAVILTALCTAMHQPTPMRRMQMAPCWIMIIRSNEAIPTQGVTAARSDVVIQFHGALRRRTTCLLAFSVLHCIVFSTSWIVTCLAWAFFFFFWLRDLTFRLCFRCEPGTATKIGIRNVRSVGSSEKPGSGVMLRPAMAAFRSMSPLGSPELHGCWL